jgi:RNA polymerase sigma-32 factor
MAFDAPSDADDDEKPAPVAYLVDHNADPYEALESENQEESELDSLQNGLAKLDARSRDIITRRWLKDGDKATLQELADEYGVSAERIRQVEVNAMKKMRAAFAA